MNTPLKNDRFIRALLRQPVDKTPIWIMRQAGRYLPEYRAIREKAGNFMSLCQNPQLACEVTLQPLDRFDLDAAILFSDILTIPDAMGLGLYFATNEGPKFERPLRDKASIEKLGIPDPSESLRYVTDAVSLIRQELDGRVPLIGFTGSPWTLATYMIEGGSSKTFSLIKGMMYSDPKTLHLLLDKIADSVILYLNAQIHAGAQALMIFDTWGGVLSPEAYEVFSLQYMEKILDGLDRNYGGQKIPCVLFSKGTAAHALEKQANTSADGLGLDWTTNIGEAFNRVGDNVALQGNMDPGILFGSPETVQAEAEKILREVGDRNGHIFNLGHGIQPLVDPDNVSVLVDTVHKVSADIKSGK